MKRFYIVFASLMVLALFVSACGAAGSPGEEQSAQPVVLVIGSNGGQLTSMDRFANFGFVVDDTSSLFTDPLVGSDHHQNYEPGLATEWTPSADYISWTFKLREGVKFHSGNDFTSADVKFTFERLLTDKTLTDVGSWGNLDHVDTPDAYTAVIVLKGVGPTFLDEIGRVYILDSKAYEADPANYFYLPSGTGAFKVTSFDKTTGEIHYARNDAWWGWTEANKTNVDQIIYKQIGDDTTRASALQAGDVDIATQLTPDYKTKLDESKYNIITVNSDVHTHIQFNCAEGKIFNDKNLREALSLSIDRKSLVESILSGGATVADFPVPPGNLGYVAGYTYEYNVDRAKELVAASAYKGEEIVMIVSNTAITRAAETAQAIQAMAAQAGFNIKIDAQENASFMDRRFAGDFDLSLGSFAATAGDPQVEAGVIINFDVFKSGYVNEELHVLTMSIMGMADRAERGKVLEQIFTIEMNEFAPFVYLYNSSYIYGTSKNVENLTVYADGSANYKFVTKN